ncbi:MAG: polyprenol phosphomannose-dependent alpha 1,6 mannosyltransferase MptB [Sciscionella sp.]
MSRLRTVRTLLLGAIGSVALVIGGLGAGGVLVYDPVLARLGMQGWRLGTGHTIAEVVVYIGVVLLVWAWVRLGRDVFARRVGSRAVLACAAGWLLPTLVSPPLFTRDVFSYIGQGALALHGYDPYSIGPAILGGPIAANVHPFWLHTPAPYGPLFILLAKIVAWIIGAHLILGVILMRLVLAVGLALLLWALPRLVGELGGRLPVTLWLVVASPMMVVHLFGGPHNDLLMVGLLAAGVLLVLRGQHVGGIALTTTAMAVKATAGIALPFLVWVWAGHLEGTLRRRFLRACSMAVGIFVVVFAACTLLAGVNLGWITALRAPTMIVNWLNPPTGVGIAVHALASLFGNISEGAFVVVARGFGVLLLLYILIKQWWAARTGGIDAVRRLGLVLCAVAVLSPPTLPWYLSWGFVLLAARPWRKGPVAVVIALTMFLVIAYFPSGEDATHAWGYLTLAIAGSVFAGLAFDPPMWLRRLRDRSARQQVAQQ